MVPPQSFQLSSLSSRLFPRSATSGSGLCLDGVRFDDRLRWSMDRRSEEVSRYTHVISCRFMPLCLISYYFPLVVVLKAPLLQTYTNRCNSSVTSVALIPIKSDVRYLRKSISQTENIRIEVPVIVVIPVQKVIQTGRHVIHKVDVFAGYHWGVEDLIQDVRKFLLDLLAHAIVPLTRSRHPRKTGNKHTQITDDLCAWQGYGVWSRLLRLTENLEGKDAGAGKAVVKDLNYPLAMKDRDVMG
jgi:hypothetical protein